MGKKKFYAVFNTCTAPGESPYRVSCCTKSKRRAKDFLEAHQRKFYRLKECYEIRELEECPPEEIYPPERE
jgi:hypothetical protein